MRRPCQYCTRPLGRWARWLLIWTCRGCVNRLSMGGSPMRPPPDTAPAQLPSAPAAESATSQGR